MLLKADRALSKLNFLFHLKSKANLVTLQKSNSHLQYYKIDLSFSIKLREIICSRCVRKVSDLRSYLRVGAILRHPDRES